MIAALDSAIQVEEYLAEDDYKRKTGSLQIQPMRFSCEVWWVAGFSFITVGVNCCSLCEATMRE